MVTSKIITRHGFINSYFAFSTLFQRITEEKGRISLWICNQLIARLLDLSKDSGSQEGWSCEGFEDDVLLPKALLGNSCLIILR